MCECNKWSTMDTAPRDGTEILLYIPTMEFTKVTMGRVSKDGTVWRMYEDRPDEYGSWSTTEATHWQPIEPPKGQ